MYIYVQKHAQFRLLPDVPQTSQTHQGEDLTTPQTPLMPSLTQWMFHWLSSKVGKEGQRYPLPIVSTLSL